MRTTVPKLLLVTLPPLMPLLTGCGPAPLRVRPAEPLPPPCLTVPQVILAPVPLPTWLPSPAPISTSSPAQRCVPQSRANGPKN